MKIIFIVAIICLFLFFFLWQGLIFFSIIKFYSLKSILFQRIIISCLVFFSFSYFMAEFLSRYSVSVPSRVFYAISGSWLAISMYILFACIIIWVVNFIHHFKNPVFFTCMLSLAVIVFVLGLLNASRIKVRNLDIKIDNLPITWQNKKIVQISDIHLGPLNRKKFIEKIITLVNKQNPSAVFITGDYFDGVRHQDEDITMPLNKLKTEYGVFAINGNHDDMYGLDEADKKLTAVGVRVLRDEIVNIKGLEIIGAEYRGPESTNKKTYLPLLTKHASSPSIMLAHEPVLIQEVADAKIDLLLCGHTHKGQVWPFTYLPYYFFQKYYYGLQEEGALKVYTSSGVGTWGPPIRVGSSPEIVVINLSSN